MAFYWSLSGRAVERGASKRLSPKGHWGRANLGPRKKGESGNNSGRPKDLARFGDILMKELYKTLVANMGRKTVEKGPPR